MSQQNLYTLSLDSIKYVLGLIRETVALPTTILDDLNIATNTTYSSYRLDTLLKALKDENIKYCDEAIAGLNKLSKEIVDDSSKVVKENTIYLILTNPVNNVYEQWLLINGTPQMIGTTEMNLDSVYTKDEADARYTLITDFNTLKTKVDGKVDKTNIVTAKNNSATDDQVYSAKAINTELDGVVKKVDISTIIDSTSTNDTVPTNKSVWDSLYKICDTQVLADANNPTSKICMADLTTLNTPSKEGVTSAESSLIISIEGRDYWNGQISISMAEPEVYVRSVRDANTWTKWRKLCSSSVEDVPVTTITTNLASTKVALSNIDSYATYYVKNGTCYVTIWSMTILAACSVETIFNDLPKSAVGATCPLCNGEESFAQVFISPNSKVIAFNASATTINKNGYCSFSYPVAES